MTDHPRDDGELVADPYAEPDDLDAPAGAAEGTHDDDAQEA